ncbi:MAG: 3-dehydroquinate synthase family protein [Candidatus Cloacimonadales bacterium]
MSWIEEYQKRISIDKSSSFISKLAQAECFIITDNNLEKLYHDEILQKHKYYSIEPGEASKTLSQANKILERMLKLNLTRNVIVVGFGGGVVCDLTGFVSAIYKRGCPLFLMPTSLLAMVDAAIGGKNGVNSKNYKNQFGTIRHPNWINIDQELLESLPAPEYLNGAAEMIKHGLIYSLEYHAKVKAPYTYVLDHQSREMQELIKESIAIKLHFVSDDEGDRGKRRYLNFGHTLGHVIEKQLNIPHGVAVIWGMIQAIRLSYHSELISSETFTRLRDELRLAIFLKQFEIEWKDIAKALLNDKKREGEGITFILLTKVGSPVVKELSLEFIKNAIMGEDGVI